MLKRYHIDEEQDTVMHQSSYREKDKAKGIVVFIHGFLGSPNQFSDWSEEVFALGYSVASLLLPGHGPNAERLFRINESDWTKHVENEIKTYRGKYQQIFLVGHSIGGLIALKIAASDSLPLTGICVIAAPIKMNYIAPFSILSRIRLVLSRNDSPIKKTYAASISVPGLSIISVPTILHSFFEIKKLIRTLGDLAHITLPVLLIYSRKDETVSFKSMSMLESRLLNASTSVLSLPSSLHAYYLPDERAIIAKTLCKFIVENSSSETYRAVGNHNNAQ